MSAETISYVAAKGGAMIAGSAMMADLVIFTDHSYIYLAIVGAIVSMFGVIHEVFGVHASEYSVRKAIAEVIKGFSLGLIAIPFWYLSITEGIVGKMLSIDMSGVSNSLALLASFALSWYTVPIFDMISSGIKRRVK